MTRGEGVFVRFKNTKKEKESGRVGYAIWCLFLSQFCLYEIHTRASEMGDSRIPHHTHEVVLVIRPGYVT
jgi:hypothetical protein